MSEAETYLEALLIRLRELLGDDLVGVYAGGSYALGGYLPGRSDLDVAVVSRSPLADEKKAEIVEALRHEALPCPARGLELVVYAESTVRAGTGEPGYELNLNTGRAMPFVASFTPEGEPHWYAIDRAVVREHGIVLSGPPPYELFATIPRAVLLERVAKSVRWYARHAWAGDDNAVLNACRAWRFASEGVWSSKPDAGEWVRDRLDDDGLVVEALAARSGEGRLDHARVEAFLVAVQGLLASAAESANGLSHS